jgi:hypothetical protein
MTSTLSKIDITFIFLAVHFDSKVKGIFIGLKEQLTVLEKRKKDRCPRGHKEVKPKKVNRK